jgi:lambda family phage minor tail protein L
MIVDINKQRVTSDLVELYILIVNGTSLYFTTYHQSVQFRDYTSPYTNRTYNPIPVEFSGFEHKSDGAYARPRIVFANVLTTFKDAIGISNDGLVGAKIIRRRTLQSNLTTNPPIELPIQSFIIDRVESENALAVSFELTTAFDLAGVTIPNRIIVPNTCPWYYQGAASDRTGEKIGGCTFKEASNNAVTAYFDTKNNWLSSLGDGSFTTYAGSATKDSLYKVSATVTRNETNGTTTSQTRSLYYQALVNYSGAITASKFRLVRLYTSHSGATTYYTYADARYNDCVLYDNKIWSVTKTHSGQTPSITSGYWQRVDVCGKKLSSCAIRFRAKNNGSVVSVDLDNTKELPYGGFPAARRYGR